MTTTLTIGKLAKEAGVNIDTVRYYERRQLLLKPERTPSGYRIYQSEAITRIKFIKRAQVLGFSLDEIRELFQLRIDTDSACKLRKVPTSVLSRDTSVRAKTARNA